MYIGLGTNPVYSLYYIKYYLYYINLFNIQPFELYCML